MIGIFGTDGVRSRINTGPMRAEYIVRLALAAGEYFISKNNSFNKSSKPIVVIGKDTRLSGYMLEAALVSGFTSIGMDCRLLGPIPTAGVAYLTHSLRAELGVMISASHNPHFDNGIKLFGPDGFKLDDDIELQISNLLQGSISLAEPALLGRAKRMVDSVARYVEFSKGKFTDSFFNFGDLNFLPLICYEAIFPSKIKYLNHYDVIINITNDYWFGNTFGPHQHHSLAKQRAIETGIPVLRVSNSGISSIIGPNGKELKKLDYDKKGFIDFQVPEKFEPTLYLMYGEKIYYYISIILILLIILIRSQVSK